jgi:hypothetical protein
MKGGRTPIHVQKWCPADFQADPDVKLLLKRRDYLTLAFYRQFLDVSFTQGGDLPADIEELSACLMLPERDCRKALEFCLGRLLFETDGRLYQRRVRAEVSEELEFRSVQSAHGKNGGRPRKERVAFFEEKGMVLASESPPSPSSTSSSPSSALEESARETRRAVGPAEPAAKRVRKEPEDFSETPLPPILDAPEFREAWRERCAVCREKGGKLRQTTGVVESQMALLVRAAAPELGGLPHAIDCLRLATAGGWQGVVQREDLAPPRNGNGGHGHRRERPAPAGATSELFADAEELQRGLGEW